MLTVLPSFISMLTVLLIHFWPLAGIITMQYVQENCLPPFVFLFFLYFEAQQSSAMLPIHLFCLKLQFRSFSHRSRFSTRKPRLCTWTSKLAEFP
jgi:hypothetical protein